MANNDKALKLRESSGLVQIGKRAVSTRGFRVRDYIEHLEDHLIKNEWCTIECHARVFGGGRNSIHNRKAARLRLPRVFRSALEHGMFLVIDYARRGGGHYGEALQVKLLRAGPQSEMEHQIAAVQLDRMLQRKEISEGLYQRALLLMK